jgi:group II intron reverse transcriptase/maturase/CRISPR-associated endonuclease Cas1
MTKSLFAQFIDDANFLRAFQRVQEKNSQGGIDRVSVNEFAGKLYRNLKELRREIEFNQYTPEPVQGLAIPKFNGKGEFRQLGLPTVRDKIVQTALLQVVEPLAEKLFCNTSYGYRKGKGPAKAIRRVEHNLIGKFTWVVRQDVDNFFDTLNHDRLLQVFAELVDNDQNLVQLVALWCRSGIVAKSGKWRTVETGVRQGQVISPLLANLYLHALDEWVEAKGWGWVRYADDYLIQVKEQEVAIQANREVTEFLEKTLDLHLNANTSPISNLEQGFSFLGVFFQGARKEIAAKKIDKMHNKMCWLCSPKGKSEPEKLLNDLEMMAGGWKHYYGFLDPLEQFAALDQEMAKRFSELAAQRIASGAWPAKPSADWHFPMLLLGVHSRDEEKKRLQELWKQSQPLSSGELCVSAKKVADKKNAARRIQYQRKQLQAGELIVTTPGHFVGRRDNRIVVRCHQKIVSEVPVEHFTGLTMGGRGLSLSTDLIHLCTEKNITIHFIDSLGKIFAIACSPDGERAELVQRQLMHRDGPLGLHLAKMFILGKVKNQFALLKSYAKYKDRQGNGFYQAFQAIRPELEKGISAIKSLKRQEPKEFRSALMGLEGINAARYWRMVGLVVPAEQNFTGRVGYGAADLVNSLLNYGYGILYTHAHTAITRAGLNAGVGFLHADQGKKPTLTFDLIEEFRAPVVDRAVISMLNRREQLGQTENGELDKETKRKIAACVLARLGGEISHQGRKDTIKNVLYGQALAIRDVVSGKGEYKPFLARW